MAYGNYNPAYESAFDPEVTAVSLLDAIRANVNSNINTIEAAAAAENELSEQAIEFNRMLMTIQNAINKAQSGEITPEEAKAEVAPCVSALKTNCKALNLANVSMSSDDIDEKEIAMLSEVIAKSKDIVSARKKDLEDCPITANASEGVLSMFDDMSYAMESASVDQIKKSTAKKTADTLYKNAKKLYGMGNKEKAVEYMTQAKGLYEKLVADCKKLAGAHKVQRSVQQGRETDKNRITDTYSMSTISDKSAAKFVDYLEDRADSCQAWLLKWKSNSEKADYKALKAKLKSERKEQRHANFEKWKEGVKSIPEKIMSIPDHIKAKFTKDPEAAVQEGLAYMDFVDACESLMDDCMMDLALEAAMESAGSGYSDSIAMEGFGEKIRGLFSRLKKAKAENDTEEMNAVNSEIQDTVKEAEAADDGSEESKKGLSKVAKVGLAAAAAVAVGTAALTGIGQAAMKQANGDINNVHKGLRTITKLSNAIVNAPATIKANHEANKVYNKKVAEAKQIRDLNSKHYANLQKSGSISRNRLAELNKTNTDKATADINNAADLRDAVKRYNKNKATTTSPFVKKAKDTPSADSFTIAGLIGTLAYESNLDDELDGDLYAPDEGKGFDDSTMFGSQMIDDATESDDALEALATESAILSYATEDGFADDV